jgi:phage shock protein A
MAGRLVEQVNRLIREGVASVTGESRDPAAQPEQAMAEHALRLVRDKLGKLIVERRRLTRQLTELPQAATDLAEKAELAVRQGREDLARAAMAEVANMTAGRAGIAEDIEGLDADIALLEDAIGKLTGTQQRQPDAEMRALLAELDRLAAEAPNSDATRRQSQER